METTVIITIEQLTKRDVVIKQEHFFLFDGQRYPLRVEKTHVPNSEAGRVKLQELTQDAPEVRQAVLIIWGDISLSDEISKPE